MNKFQNKAFDQSDKYCKCKNSSDICVAQAFQDGALWGRKETFRQCFTILKQFYGDFDFIIRCLKDLKNEK